MPHNDFQNYENSSFGTRFFLFFGPTVTKSRKEKYDSAKRKRFSFNFPLKNGHNAVHSRSTNVIGFN